MSTYSVSCLFLPSVKSPNLNTDFAVMRKPMADQVLSRMNVKTKRRSKIPIILPAPAREVLLDPSFLDLGSMAFYQG